MAQQLRAQIEYRFSRMVGMGIDYNDANQIFEGLTDLRHWPAAFEVAGSLHERLGVEALALGHGATAGDAFVRAAAYFHAAQLPLFDDLEEKRRLLERRQSSSQKGLPLVESPGRILKVPFEGIELTANLRAPARANGKVPCVILTPGSDSTKEEFFTVEGEFLKRGVATLSYDGPGQGLTWFKMKMRPDFEKPVGAIIDALEKCNDIDASRIGIWGVSSGGYYAPRAACLEPRLKACVTVGGYYDLSENWERFPTAVKDTCQFMFGVDSHAAAFEKSKAYTLSGLLQKLKCPMLIIHSTFDEVCRVEDANRIQKEAGGNTVLKIFPEGNHVCHNIPYKVRPLYADWIAEQLGA